MSGRTAPGARDGRTAEPYGRQHGTRPHYGAGAMGRRVQKFPTRRMAGEGAPPLASGAALAVAPTGEGWTSWGASGDSGGWEARCEGCGAAAGVGSKLPMRESRVEDAGGAARGAER